MGGSLKAEGFGDGRLIKIWRAEARPTKL